MGPAHLIRIPISAATHYQRNQRKLSSSNQESYLPLQHQFYYLLQKTKKNQKGNIKVRSKLSRAQGKHLNFLQTSVNIFFRFFHPASADPL
jgi:hypothetical protein